MIEATGIVMAIDGDELDVAVTRQSACGHCHASDQCGTAALDKWFNRRVLHLKITNSLAADVGDHVVFAVPERQLLHVAAAVYLVPLLSLFGGAMIFARFGAWLAWGTSELWTLMGAVSGFVLALWWLARYGQHVTNTNRPVLVRIMN
jgi:sigma-E factor negative regulatory protein RseC